MDFLHRLWTGIVAAVAAVAVALVADLVGTMLAGLPVEFLPWIVLVFGTVGFVIGVVVGSRRRSGPKTSGDRADQREIWLE